MIFQNSLIKYLIYKIKKIKISRIFLHVQIDEIQNKMSKIKKQIVNRRILKKNISHMNIFLKERLQISRNCW